MTQAQIPVFRKGSPLVAQGVNGDTLVPDVVVDVEGNSGEEKKEEVGKVRHLGLFSQATCVIHGQPRSSDQPRIE